MAIRDDAYRDWKDGMKYREIAEKYGVSAGTVKSWASRYWKVQDAEKMQPKSEKGCNPQPKRLQPPAEKLHPKKRGAPPGSSNAKGNKGGAPIGSKNNYRHGFYYDTLTQEEKDFVDAREQITEIERLLNALDLWEIKERRILQELSKLRNSPDSLEVQSTTTSNRETCTTKISIKEYIIRLETLLTQAQRGHMRCIRDLHQIKLDCEKLELFKKKMGDSDAETLEKLDSILERIKEE